MLVMSGLCLRDSRTNLLYLTRYKSSLPYVVCGIGFWTAAVSVVWRLTYAGIGNCTILVSTLGQIRSCKIADQPSEQYQYMNIDAKAVRFGVYPLATRT